MKLFNFSVEIPNFFEFTRRMRNSFEVFSKEKKKAIENFQIDLSRKLSMGAAEIESLHAPNVKERVGGLVHFPTILSLSCTL